VQPHQLLPRHREQAEGVIVAQVRFDRERETGDVGERLEIVRPRAGRVEPCAEMRNLGIGARDGLLQATKLQRREIAARHRLGGAIEHERLIAANCARHAFTPTMRRIARPSL
jgi:hypothetical protein